MNALSHYFRKEDFEVLDAAGEIKVFNGGALDIAFFQWLLSRAQNGVSVQLLVRQSDTNLTPAYIARFHDTGNCLLQLPENVRISYSAFLLSGKHLFLPGGQAGSLFRLETSHTLATKYNELFDRLLTLGSLEQPAVPDHSPEIPGPNALATGSKEIGIHFKVSPAQSEPGRRVELSWAVTGADQVRIEPGIGSVPPRGGRLLNLDKTTLFTLTAGNAGGEKTAAVRAEVIARPKIVYFLRVLNQDGARELTLNPIEELPDHFAVVAGQTLELSWQAYHSDTLLLDGQPTPLEGSRIFHPDNRLQCLLQASGNGQESVVRLVVDVFRKPEFTRVQSPDPSPVAFSTRLELNAPAPAITLGHPSETTPPAVAPSNAESTSLALRARAFCWFCAGVNRELIRECPASESVKYVGIGIAVFFTGLLAALSGGYALYTAFNQVPAAILFGLIWGALIFNLDRLVVSSLKKDGPPGRQWIQAIPRFLLALMLSVVIAKPLELRIFKPEIDAVLAEDQIKQQQRTGALFDRNIAGLDKRIAGIKAETDRLFGIREHLYEEYRCECDGTCGTGKRGRGSECERKEQKYRQTDSEYQSLKAENDRLIASLRAEADLETTRKQTALAAQSTVRSDGLLARLNASGQLPFLPGFFIMLLILLVEIAPVLSKLLTPKGVYDYAARLAEERFKLEQEALHAQAQEKLRQQSDLRVQLEQAELHRQVDQKAAVLRLIADAQLLLVKEQVEEWVKKERENMKKST